MCDSMDITATFISHLGIKLKKIIKEKIFLEKKNHLLFQRVAEEEMQI